jgi:hypothetical protein
MSHRFTKRFSHRIGQYFGIVLCASVPLVAHAQFVWQITDTTPRDHQYTLFALSTNGPHCVACMFDDYVEGTKYYPTLKIKESSDFGQTWSLYDPQIQIPNIYHNMAVQQIDSQNAIAVADVGIILKTTDGGTTWKVLPSPYPDTYWYDVSFSDPLHGIVMGGKVCLTTTTGGETWDTAIFPQAERSDRWAIACHANPDGTISIAYVNGQVYTTTNSWRNYDSGQPPPQYAEDPAHTLAWGKCKWLGGDTVIIMGNEAFNDTAAQLTRYRGSICFSYDGGRTWAAPIIDSVLGSINDVSGYNGDTIYVSCRRDSRLYRKSVDRGRSWISDTVNFISTVPAGNRLQYTVGLAYAGDGTLIGAFDGSPLGGANFFARQVQGSRSVVTESDISHVAIYPNPSSACITISNTTADRLELRDLLGRVVLVQKISNGAIDVSSVAEGMYEVLLYSGSKLSSTEKLAIVR